MTFAPGHRARLTLREADRFAGPTLFDALGRAVCEAGTLARKELYEAWEVARRVRRRFEGGRVVDLAAGSGLVAHALLLLDRTSTEALCVDTTKPANVDRLWGALARQWPRLGSQVRYVEDALEAVRLTPTDVVVSVHACGGLTDTVLERAIAARCRVAVLPCCHDLGANDTGGLEGWMDGALAIDATRVARLRQAGFEVRTQTIPSAITPKNRLLLAWPR